MSTFLFDKIIFGPIKSRRLGISLGINLLPLTSKLCSFDCIYCECGWNPKKREEKAELPTRIMVSRKLEEKLIEMSAANECPDVITFAGNGEPTLHPEFEGIIDDTIALRDKLSPKSRIAVLSNATMLHHSKVRNALLKVDDNIQKLDSGIEGTIKRIDCPSSNFKLSELVENLKSFGGKVIIQTMFLRGVYQSEQIDNTSESELSAWLKLISEIRPSQVMIYTIDRNTPAGGLEKIKLEELQKIALEIENLGISVQVSG
jgi:wyosine [tRNA(Phe)-imidazoG37] synthetase (radical SAM superfamily)